MTRIASVENREVGGRKASHFFLPKTFLLVLALWVGVGIIQKPNSLDERTLRFMISPDLITHLTFGFRNTLADALWLRLIQNIDYKESSQVRVSKGVTFQLLDAITRLDPRYRIAYLAGGSSLSILVGDRDGATLIYDRAIENFPNDGNLLYMAGYHALYEGNDCKKAADLYNRAADHGAPYWVHILASHIYSRTGQYELAKLALEQARQKFEGSVQEAQLKAKLDELQRQYAEKGQHGEEASPLVHCK